MREIGIILNDVHKTHNKSLKEDIGIEKIKFHGDTTVNIRCKSSLITYQSSRTTIEKFQVNNLHALNYGNCFNDTDN